ncbi:Bax inhibitor-1/YccA family protein [Urechidicola vernalis]|uniref:Bax inhibitor-1/YccA family protein n=1 Tax=Urechidicola vernalis TaxID=3075600 RepID=A0ABU2Y761_9FLAO|nr:Bax inhibitor-1/YccA family protein [Urechidicola sp. P050]MDT0553532.1 Bax inhibitor-1/YccA family protein [Urechidicola sp. P050]
MALYNYKTANPAFSKDVWKGYASTSNKMTVNGIILKSLFCIFLLLTSAIFTWKMQEFGFNINILMYGGLVAALFFSLLTAFIHRLAPILVPLYALAQGLFIGGVTIYAESKFSGIAMQAIGVTISTFFLMLFLYKSRIVKVTQRFKSVIFVSIAIIMTIYACSWTLHFFNIETPFAILDSSSYLAIAFNALAAGVAAFTLLLDFDFIERKKNHVPRYMEWVATWGLLVTLVWVYVEAIRLMKKMVIN